MKETITVRYNPEQPKHMDVVFRVWFDNSYYGETLRRIMAYSSERGEDMVSDLKRAWSSDSVRLIVPVEETRAALLEAGLIKLQGTIKFPEEEPA